MSDLTPIPPVPPVLTDDSFSPPRIVGIGVALFVASSDAVPYALGALEWQRLVSPRATTLGEMAFGLLSQAQCPIRFALFGTALASGLVLRCTKQRARLVRAALWLFSCASALSWVMLLVPSSTDRTTPMGRVLTSELVLMFALQLYCISTGRLALRSLLLAPLGALALTETDAARLMYTPSSSSRALLLLLMLVPSSYANAGQDTLALAAEFHAVEWFAFLQVLGSAFVLAIRFAPAVRWRTHPLRDVLGLLVFVGTASKNIAAAWSLLL